MLGYVPENQATPGRHNSGPPRTAEYGSLSDQGRGFAEPVRLAVIWGQQPPTQPTRTPKDVVPIFNFGAADSAAAASASQPSR